MKVSAVQCRVGKNNPFKSSENLILEGIEIGVELFLLPEYFSYTIGDMSLETSKKTKNWLRNISNEYGIILAGNVIEKIEESGELYNILYIYDSGEFLGSQTKIHPTKTERELGIRCGKKIEIFDVRGIKLSALICADILYPELCRVPAIKGAEVILNPVVSLKKSELPSENLRYCMYFTRAFDNAYAVIKAGGVGYTFLGERCVGRSLIVDHTGILAKYKDEEKEELISAKIDLESIRKYKEINYSLKDRNLEAIKELMRRS